MTTRAFLAGAVLIALNVPAAAVDLPPQVAGGFYPAEKADLVRTIEGFAADPGAPNLPAGRLAGVLVPHAGYSYSGKTAAAAYRTFGLARTIVIVGTGHNMPILGAATISSGTLSTPLGAVEIDAAAVQALREAAPLIVDRPDAFKGEHSIEVQLPFLQVKGGAFKLVPVLMNGDDPEASRLVGEGLARLLRSTGTFLIVSSDLSHYPSRDTARIVDAASLSALTEYAEDPSYFWMANRLLMQRAGGRNLVCTECGEAAVLAGAYAMKALGASPHLIAYTNSGEAPGGDVSRVVGYAAVGWYAGPPEPRPPLTASEKKELLALARKALTTGLTSGAEPERALWPDPSFDLPAAVFVTLRLKNARKDLSLRGCVGTLAPAYPLAEAVQQYALESALHDSRFSPVEPDELEHLSIEVSRLSPPRTVASAGLVQKGQGVTLRQGERSGVFLPQVWEDIPDMTKFLEELCAQKAGLPRDCYKDPRTRFQVFDAEVFEE